MRLEVLEIIDQHDGSAKMVVELDYKSIVQFAKMGIIHALTEAAENSLDYHNKE